MMKKGLGKGLGALITSAGSENGDNGVTELRITEIEPNINQPRKNFNDESLIQLSESIKSHGIMQPIIVKREKDTYRIVAGERRWRAARMAGLVTVPVIIKELSNKQVMEMALIENLQREDLNAIEEADAFDRLMKEYNLTQEEVSAAVGRSRSAIANSIRLLGLGDKIKGYLINGELTSGHARTLIGIEDKELQEKIAGEIIANGLNVRDTEKLVKKYLQKKIKKENKKNIELIEIEDRLKNIFGTKVQLLSNNKKGKILIEYYSNEELDRILEMCVKIGDK
ncbi:chromosome segregation DNA-binding protein [Anaerobacterium chartisolvens]|uniref:Chromosome segregation DNA-binding protein n=1 Tax=Anaerobacterium chartisolvens TaxID=1297424 RepID=A0A369B6G7_9FIRM|nr:ParB/RepB/Spo0J family partition protein [Anaerobacterium chartisolvens]RCX16127.1 chromosome segregation DNA-binding protein [Anaerobacterium chartisolvens]